MLRATAILCAVGLLAGCRRTPEPPPTPPPSAVAPTEPAPAEPVGAPPPPVAVAPDLAGDIEEPAPVPEPVSKKPKLRLDVDDKAESRNDPDVAAFLAHRLDLVDHLVTLRVRAEPGSYFNCHYKGRSDAYYHLRLRGDGSAWLDGYLPRGGVADDIWRDLQTKPSTPLTVRVILRATTVSSVCLSQVEVVDVQRGWDFSKGQLAAPGARARFLSNQRGKTAPKNVLPVDAFLGARSRFVGKEVEFRVRARLDNYYQCRYADAERTHYAFLLQGEGYKGLRAYALRDGVGKALAQRLAGDEGAAITVTVTVPEGRFDPLCNDQVEIVDFKETW